MATSTSDRSATSLLPQGHLGLLDTDVAKRLLRSTVPARLAYTSIHGKPRVIPTWFHWTGRELVMGTFVSAPHVRRPAARLHALWANPDVAITIDTDGFPPEVLSIRGRATLAEVAGVVPEYARAARRYLGDEDADAYLQQLYQRGTTMARIAVVPTWVGVLDFQRRFPAPMRGAAG